MVKSGVLSDHDDRSGLITSEKVGTLFSLILKTDSHDTELKTVISVYYRNVNLLYIRWDSRLHKTC